MEEPTEVEVELKRRLDQMTDHLIQKQAQVCHLNNIFLVQFMHMRIRFVLMDAAI